MSSYGKLERLIVKGFKSIATLDLELRDLNVLVGANGAGKSNFIGLFELLRAIVEKNLQVYVARHLGADKLLFFGRKRTRQLEIHLKLTPNMYHATLAPDAAGGLFFLAEHCQLEPQAMRYHGSRKTLPLAPAGARESGLPEAPQTTIPGYVAAYLRDWRVYHFHDTSEAAGVKQPGRIDDADALLGHAQNLAAFLRSIREDPAFQEIVETVRRVAPFFLGFVLEPERENPKLIRLRWKHRGTDETFDASDLSDGTLRFICLATLLLQPRPPRTILIDEPELGLHPYALHLLAALLRAASARTQIIASTQSVTLANQLSWEDLVVVDRVDEASCFKRLREDDVSAWLEAFAVGELWEKNILGGTP